MDRRVGAAPYDIVFALNLACSLAYGLIVEARGAIFGAPYALWLFFVRGARRINDALGLSPVSAFWNGARDWDPSHGGEQLSREFALLACVFVAAMIVYFLLQIVAGSRLHRVIGTRLLGPSLLFAAPLSCVLAMRDSPGVFLSTGDTFFWKISFEQLVLLVCSMFLKPACGAARGAWCLGPFRRRCVCSFVCLVGCGSLPIGYTASLSWSNCRVISVWACVQRIRFGSMPAVRLNTSTR